MRPFILHLPAPLKALPGYQVVSTFLPRGGPPWAVGNEEALGRQMEAPARSPEASDPGPDAAPWARALSPRNCWYCWTWALMSDSPVACCGPTATPLVMPSIFWMGLSLEKGWGWGTETGRHAPPRPPAQGPASSSYLCFCEKGWPRMAMCCWSSISRSRGELALMRRP